MSVRFRFNPKYCVACGACAIACMDQNDIDLARGDLPFRQVGVQERTEQPFRYFSRACMHCPEAPCIPACPKGCLKKNSLGLTEYDNAACIGCRACFRACPFDAPTFPREGQMEKCSGCQTRLECGLLPACVRVCPTGALTLEQKPGKTPIDV